MNILLPKNHYFWDKAKNLSAMKNLWLKKKKQFIPFSTGISFMYLLVLVFKTHFGYCSCHELNMTVTQRNVRWYESLQNVKSTADFLFLSILKILRLA